MKILARKVTALVGRRLAVMAGPNYAQIGRREPLTPEEYEISKMIVAIWATGGVCTTRALSGRGAYDKDARDHLLNAGIIRWVERKALVFSNPDRVYTNAGPHRHWLTIGEIQDRYEAMRGIDPSRILPHSPEQVALLMAAEHCEIELHDDGKLYRKDGGRMIDCWAVKRLGEINEEYDQAALTHHGT